MPPSGQELIKNLFDYVIAYTQIKTPCARNIFQQPWSQYLGDVPKHETIQFTPPSTSDAASGRALLKVGRAKLNELRVPPEILLEWIEAAETRPVAIGSFGAGAGGMRGRNPNAPPGAHHGSNHGYHHDPNSFGFAVWQLKEGEDKIIADRLVEIFSEARQARTANA